MNSTTARALERIQELKDLSGAMAVLGWDQETYMPKKGAGGRAAQMATLSGIYHEKLVDPMLGDWLAATANGPGDEGAMARALKRERDRSVNVPVALVKALAEAQSTGVEVWKESRAAREFKRFAPALETLLRLRREQADAIGHQSERYDALLDGHEPQMRAARLKTVFEALKTKLVPIARALLERPAPKDIFAGKTFAHAGQEAFTLEVLKSMGFDLDAGRQDKSAHPFSSGTHREDVRLTTRYSDDTPLPAIFGTIHEGGHGLYEQGFDPKDDRTPLSAAASFGLHESQSRLWENMIGRSPQFWAHFFPVLVRHLPGPLAGVTAHDFVRAANRVERSLIRVEADEVTYNLHIILRFDLELRLFRDELKIADLEAAWNESSQELLGRKPAHSGEGVLQDIHWSFGEFGYFPTYAVGNLYAASILAAAERALPNLWTDVEKGQLVPLREWLRREIHHQGSRLFAEELVTRVTGRGLSDDDFVGYLKRKYGRLYDCSL